MSQKINKRHAPEENEHLHLTRVFAEEGPPLEDSLNEESHSCILSHPEHVQSPPVLSNEYTSSGILKIQTPVRSPKQYLVHIYGNNICMHIITFFPQKGMTRALYQSMHTADA